MSEMTMTWNAATCSGCGYPTAGGCRCGAICQPVNNVPPKDDSDNVLPTFNAAGEVVTPANDPPPRFTDESDNVLPTFNVDWGSMASSSLRNRRGQ